MSTPVFMEPLVGYQPCFIGILTRSVTSLRTVSGGQFDIRYSVYLLLWIKWLLYIDSLTCALTKAHVLFLEAAPG